jgi:hypothetical protein
MALAHATASARFREMWRVLEAAFQPRDSESIGRLAEYGPATEMGFDRGELREVHTLRGRASRAELRSGVRELEHVERECGARIARLGCLAERVILTKRSWGTVIYRHAIKLRKFGKWPDDSRSCAPRHRTPSRLLVVARRYGGARHA